MRPRIPLGKPTATYDKCNIAQKSIDDDATGPVFNQQLARSKDPVGGNQPHNQYNQWGMTGKAMKPEVLQRRGFCVKTASIKGQTKKIEGQMMFADQQSMVPAFQAFERLSGPFGWRAYPRPCHSHSHTSLIQK